MPHWTPHHCDLRQMQTTPSHAPIHEPLSQNLAPNTRQFHSPAYPDPLYPQTQLDRLVAQGDQVGGNLHRPPNVYSASKIPHVYRNNCCAIDTGLCPARADWRVHLHRVASADRSANHDPPNPDPLTTPVHGACGLSPHCGTHMPRPIDPAAAQTPPLHPR